MSDYCFGVGSNKPTKKDETVIDKIAKKHNCCFISGNFSGEYKHWFSGPNKGYPFDRILESAIYADLESAGLLDPSGTIKGK